MEFWELKGFTEAVRALLAKGMYTNAVKDIEALRCRIYDGKSGEDVFRGYEVTNHGESRIPNCIKYELQGRARLVTVRSNGAWILLFAGTHDDVDRWLDSHKGMDFIASRKGGDITLTAIRSSNASIGLVNVAGSGVDYTPGPLLARLSTRQRRKLLEGVAADLVAEIETLDSMVSDERLVEIALQCGSDSRVTLIHDVLSYLRAGDKTSAEQLIAVFSDDLSRLAELPPEKVGDLVPGDGATLVRDLDPELFRHFLNTATLEQWMLYLHPAQREQVDRDHAGPARLTGVSGSGKTCVIVHRALRLAQEHPQEKVLVLTLNPALATLINKLVDAARGEARPKNLEVTTVWELCYARLLQREPHMENHYTKLTVATNKFAQIEHVDEIWREYFDCETNNNDADVMFDVVRTLAARGVFARDYLRQEFDYIRSALAPDQREQYLSMERTGRVEPLLEQYRRAILNGLRGWEAKMGAVGVMDDLGITAALYRHLKDLKPEFRCVLVDEVQDLGTLELAIIRQLTHQGENDLFLCGDSAQSIHTKHADLKVAGIATIGRSLRLNQNYRNSRQILEAAHAVLTRSYERIPKGAADIDVLPPEYANFSSARPMLMREESLSSELAHAVRWLRETVSHARSHQKACLAVCGFSQRSLEALARRLDLPMLSAGVDVSEDQVFLSDLEHTKGFEFDTVVISNCAASTLPHPSLPAAESFRDLCRLYVAMTRAKTQLVVSYSGNLSPFVEGARELFIESCFGEHGVGREDLAAVDVPPPAIPAAFDPAVWDRKGRDFLRSRDAVGLGNLAQQAILNRVTGREFYKLPGHRQEEWKSAAKFVYALDIPQVRSRTLSPEAYAELKSHFDGLKS